MIDSVPLIQNANDAQQINASIIAMKKASRELDEKIVKLNSLNSELDKKIALLDSGLNKEIEDRKEAINSLDVSSVGGSGKYISAISETDGKISATVSDITSSVSSGNSQPVTSGGVADSKYTKIFDMNNLSVSGWYKIASLSTRPYGSSVMIDLCTGYNYNYNGSHKVQINYGWNKAEVFDFAQDERTVFDKIRICYNSNNNDYVVIYVHYSQNSSNSVFLNINACSRHFIPFNFETDSLTWENTIEYNLGSSGLYINGQSYNVLDSVTNGNLQPVSSNAVYTTLAKYETVEISANQLQNGFAKTNWGELTFKKIGKIVFITCNGVYPTSQITTDTVICDIPFPTPDSSPFYFTGTKSGGPFNNYWFGISNNKLICFGTNNMPASTWILFSTSYITN